jgi:hypothetical protein
LCCLELAPRISDLVGGNKLFFEERSDTTQILAIVIGVGCRLCCLARADQDRRGAASLPRFRNRHIP